MLKKILSLVLVSGILYSCQEEITIVQQTKPQTNTQQNKPTSIPTVIPSLKAEEQPKDSEKNELDQNDKEVVGTDTEAMKTNINWKEYNPIVKGKKYTYNYSIKEGSSNIQTETIWEIISVNDKSYIVRQSFSTSGENKLRSTDVPVNLNSDFSPPIIPPVSVGGEKITEVKKVEINEIPEKVKVPFKEFDAIKVVSGNITTWYGKDVGLIKSIITVEQSTYTLELKDFK